MPIAILYDPPGDKSYVELDKTTKQTTTWSFNASTTTGTGVSWGVKMGADFFEGLGMEVEGKDVETHNESWKG